MARLIVYYAHPGHKYSHVNRFMARTAAAVEGITYVRISTGTTRVSTSTSRSSSAGCSNTTSSCSSSRCSGTRALRSSRNGRTSCSNTASPMVSDGDKLTGKTMMLAVTAAGPKDAYTDRAVPALRAADLPDAAGADRAALQHALHASLRAVLLIASAERRPRRSPRGRLPAAARSHPRRSLRFRRGCGQRRHPFRHVADSAGS